MAKNTVIINNTTYDATTGDVLRVERPERKVAASASDLHDGLQKSRTLQRKYIRRSTDGITAKQRPAPKVIHRKNVQRTVQNTRHPSVEHFARVKPATTQKNNTTPDIAPTVNSVAEKARQRQAVVRQPRQTLPSEVIKKQAIQEATAKMPNRSQRKEVKAPRKSSLFKRLASVGSVSLAVLLLGAYFTYINMPMLSTRVAAAQAGINATYPSYQPAGYSLSGPVAYQRGSVVMKFAANGSSENFTLAQTQSDWDSLAVLENYVKPNSGEKYSTTNANGLTIYSYDNNSVWVSGGILYSVSGDAMLAPEQIQKLAISL